MTGPGVGAAGVPRTPDKDSPGSLAPHAVPADGAASSTHRQPGSHNPESSTRPILTVRSLAARNRIPLHQARRLADLFTRVGLWEPYGMLPDGTPTYTFAHCSPARVVLVWTAPE